MYNINLLGKAMVTSEKNMKTVRFLKLFSLLLTFLFIFILIYSLYTFYKMHNTTIEIIDLKDKIDASRRINKVKEFEQNWLTDYYKVMAIKDLISNNTKTGLLLREAGLYIPEGDKFCGFELTESNEIKGLLKPAKVPIAEEFKIYAENLQEAYTRSAFFGQPIVFEEEIQDITVKGRKVQVIKFTIPYIAGRNDG